VRTIFIGDIHGCIEETRELLAAVAPAPDDQVISLGDVVDKGPASEECVSLWIERGYRAVRGNRDAQWLASRRTRGPIEQWLMTRPLFIDMPERDVIAVHGGIVPWLGISGLDRQSHTLDSLRFVRREDGGKWVTVPKGEEREGDVFWADLWDGERTVVYAHVPTASREPAVRAKSVGIDTGCVYGGRLTAAILEKGAWSFASVKAKKKYARRA
jgi:hypothetical protein